jgi:hypothetical protein
LAPLPAYACWRHCGAREGFETVFFDHSDDTGMRIEGHTTALEDGEPFAVRYAIEIDEDWRTRSVRVFGRSRHGSRATTLHSDGAGNWLVDGESVRGLDGCMDVDLESSACTNALPVHRLGLARGQAADVPAAYVRALSLEVSRLEQRYLRIDDEPGRQRYRYEAPEFTFRCELLYDDAGLVLEYPGLARRSDT